VQRCSDPVPDAPFVPEQLDTPYDVRHVLPLQRPNAFTIHKGSGQRDQGDPLQRIEAARHGCDAASAEPERCSGEKECNSGYGPPHRGAGASAAPAGFVLLCAHFGYDVNGGRRHYRRVPRMRSVPVYQHVGSTFRRAMSP
jgi:hypothetical protein